MKPNIHSMMIVMIRKVIDYTIIPLFYLITLPICSLIALMDWNNGKTFIENLKEILGVQQNNKK